MTLPAVSVSQSPEDKFREFLATRSKPQRYTDQQRDMVRYIFQQHHHFDADQLIEMMKADDLDVSRATVYRTLGKLVEAGLLRKLEVGPRMCYEHDYGYPQHEHLVCGECEKMIEFESPELTAILTEVAKRHRFNMAGHTLLIRGTCIECGRAKSSKRALDLI